MSDYLRGIRQRVERASSIVMTSASRQSVELAAQTLRAMSDHQFPADYRHQFNEIMAFVTRDYTSSIPEAVALLTEDEIRTLRKLIGRFYIDVCEPPASKVWDDQIGGAP